MTQGPASFHVRPARAADLSACAEIYEIGQREIMPGDSPGTWAREGFGRAVEGEEIHVAEAAGGGEIAGFVSLWRPQPFVHFLHVRRQWRRRGVGTALLERAVSTVAGPVSLKCLADNAVALRFYARLGWTEGERVTGTREPYVRLWLNRLTV